MLRHLTVLFFFFFSSRRRHTRSLCDWSSDVCSSDLRMSSGGAQPEDIRRLEDWRRLPLLTKAELRDAYPFGLACGRELGYRRVHMSSGTTGNPILNPYTAADVAQWGEVVARCYVAEIGRAH